MRLDDVIKDFDVNIRQFSRQSEASEFDKLAETAQRSIDIDDDDFDNHLGELKGRIFQILWRQDWFVIQQFIYFANSPHLFKNKDRYEELAHIGMKLLEHPEIKEILDGKRIATIKSEVVDQLRRIVVQMMEILYDRSGLSPDDITNILAEKMNVR